MNYKKIEQEFERSIELSTRQIVWLVIQKYVSSLMYKLGFQRVRRLLGRAYGVFNRKTAPLTVRLKNNAKKILVTAFGESAISHRFIQKIKPKPISTVPLIRNQPLSFVYQGQSIDDIQTCVALIKKIDCKVVLCCAFYGRHAVLESVLSESLDDPEIGVCLVGSSQSDRVFLEKVTQNNASVLGVISNNFPLGQKWQNAIDAGIGFFNTSLFAITGSDDIFPVSTLKQVCKHYDDASNKPSLYGCRSWYVYFWLEEGYERQILKCQYSGKFTNKTLGAGRVFTRHFLNSEGSAIFDPKKSRRLDECGHDKAANTRGNVFYYDDCFDLPISVKGKWAQMNDISEIINAKTLTVEILDSKTHRILLKKAPQLSAFEMH